jgi:hypothetical protein
MDGIVRLIAISEIAADLFALPRTQQRNCSALQRASWDTQRPGRPGY